jgi:hypothetical protein
MVGSALAGFALLAVSACASVPGITSSWSAMAEPTGWQPTAGACSAEFFAQAYRATYSPIDCTTDHRYETVFVGQFTGAAAQLSSPPVAASAEMKAAWADCDAKTTEFLGGEWRDGRIWIGVSTPSNGNWSGGARWYRCEAAARESLWEGAVSSTKSLKGEFGADSLLKYGCYHVEKESADFVDKACTEAHNAEYTGFFIVGYAWADLKNHSDEFLGKCRSIIAKYAGVPDDRNVKYRTGVWVERPTLVDYNAGDTTMRCYMWLGNENKTRSIKGAGNSGLPIHYA